MLTQEDDVEIYALAKRRWSISTIARHAGRDRKTIRRYLAGQGGAQRQDQAPSCLEPFCPYIAARFAEDPHLLLSVLCQWPSVSPQRRPSNFPTGEHGFSPPWPSVLPA